MRTMRTCACVSALLVRDVRKNISIFLSVESGRASVVAVLCPVVVVITSLRFTCACIVWKSSCFFSTDSRCRVSHGIAHIPRELRRWRIWIYSFTPNVLLPPSTYPSEIFTFQTTILLSEQVNTQNLYQTHEQTRQKPIDILLPRAFTEIFFRRRNSYTHDTIAVLPGLTTGPNCPACDTTRNVRTGVFARARANVFFSRSYGVRRAATFYVCI